MSEELGYVSLESNNYGVKSYSDSTNFEIDLACDKIIRRCREECERLVKKYKEEIKSLSKVLLKKKTIDLKDII